MALLRAGFDGVEDGEGFIMIGSKGVNRIRLVESMEVSWCGETKYKDKKVFID